MQRIIIKMNTRGFLAQTFFVNCQNKNQPELKGVYQTALRTMLITTLDIKTTKNNVKIE